MIHNGRYNTYGLNRTRLIIRNSSNPVTPIPPETSPYFYDDTSGTSREDDKIFQYDGSVLVPEKARGDSPDKTAFELGMAVDGEESSGSQ